eukprot:jgi/Tetstr1/462777/TSEL_007728.t1
MSGSGSMTDPKMVDAGKAAVVESVETSAIGQARTEAGRREAEDESMRQFIRARLYRFFATQETNMPPAAASEEDTIPGGKKSRAEARSTRILLYASCYGAFVAGLAIELRKLLAAACVTNVVTPAFGQRLEAVVHSMEDVDDYYRFRLAYLRKHWNTQMHNNGETFALDVVRERYLRPGTDNMGSPELIDLLEICEDGVYDANIASAAKTSALSGLAAAPGTTTARRRRRRRRQP